MDTKQCKSPSPRRGACVGVYQDTCLTPSVGDSPPTLQKGSNDISKPAKILTSDVGTTTSLRGSAIPGPCLAARFLAVSVLYIPWHCSSGAFLPVIAYSSAQGRLSGEKHRGGIVGTSAVDLTPTSSGFSLSFSTGHFTLFQRWRKNRMR